MSVLSDMKSRLLRKNIERAMRNGVDRKETTANKKPVAGILFEVGNVDERYEAESFASFLKQQSYRPYLFGFLNEKSKEPLHFPFNFFTKKEVNWLGIPKGEMVDQFASKKFDLLINLNLSKHKPIEYLCATSDAEIKMGPIPGHSEHSYDVIVDIGAKGNVKDLRREIWNLVQKFVVSHVKVEV